MVTKRPAFASLPKKTKSVKKLNGSAGSKKAGRPSSPLIRNIMNTLPSAPTLEDLAQCQTLEPIYAVLSEISRQILHYGQADDWDHIEKLNEVSIAAIEKLKSLETTLPIEHLSDAQKTLIRDHISTFLKNREDILAIAHPKMDELKEIILSSTQSKGFMGNTGYF